jgi:hypothetical protein
MTDRVLPSSRQPLAVTAAGNGDAGKERRRSAAEIEADLQATAQRLSANVDALVDRVSPKQIARSSVTSARGLVTTDSGRVRPEVVGAIVGAIAGGVVLIWWARRR